MARHGGSRPQKREMPAWNKASAQASAPLATTIDNTSGIMPRSVKSSSAAMPVRLACHHSVTPGWPQRRSDQTIASIMMPRSVVTACKANGSDIYELLWRLGGAT